MTKLFQRHPPLQQGLGHEASRLLPELSHPQEQGRGGDREGVRRLDPAVLRLWAGGCHAEEDREVRPEVHRVEGRIDVCHEGGVVGDVVV